MNWNKYLAVALLLLVIGLIGTQVGQSMRDSDHRDIIRIQSERIDILDKKANLQHTVILILLEDARPETAKKIEIVAREAMEKENK